MALLDGAAQRLLERLRVRVRPKTASTDPGAQRSRVRANGLEFAERREYAPGDDARKIDWNAFARNRSLSVRTFEEERDARIYVLVDVSASMTRGTPQKLEVARQLVASFGYLGLNQVDRIQVVPFARSVQQATEVWRRKDDYPALEAFLGRLEPGGVTSFEQTARTFVQQFPARGFVIVVSDLMETANWDASVRALAQRGHQLCVVRVHCAEDHDPSFRGEIELQDVETSDTLRVTVTEALLGAYRAEIRDHVERTRESCRRAGGRLVDASTDVPFDQLLRQVLADSLDAR